MCSDFRSSVYVKQFGAGMSKSKSPPKGIDFKVPSKSAAVSATTRTRRSSVYHKSSQSAISRRSSVYSKGSKGTLSSLALNEAEELKLVSPKGKKIETPSPKGKKFKLASPSGKKAKSPVNITRSRKRNVSELEKEDSPERPVAKRRRQQAGNVSLSVSPKKGKKSSAKSPVKRPNKKAGKVISSVSTPQPATKRDKKDAHSATRKTAVKSPQKNPAAKSPSPVRRGKSTRTKKRASADADDDADEEEEDAKNGKELTLDGSTSSSTSKTQKSHARKRKTKEDASKDTPKRKSAKSSPKPKSKDSKSSSAKKSTRKIAAKKSRPASKALLFDSEEMDKKTPSKRGEQAESSKERRAATPKSTSKSKRKSPEKAPLSTRKMSSQRGRQVEESSEENTFSITSSKSESSAASKRKLKTPRLKTKPTTPNSSPKHSSSKTRSQRGKKSIGTKTPSKKDSASTDTGKTVVTPKSGLKSHGKSQKKSASSSSTKKLASTTRSVRKSTKKTIAQTSGSLDSLDGSYLQVSVQQLKMNSPSVGSPASSKKVTSSNLKGARSLEDERILEILRDAVGSTPKPMKISTPKSTKSSKKSTSTAPKRQQSAQKSAKSATIKRQTTKVVATPRSAKLSQNSLSSSVTMGASARKTPRIAVTSISTPKSASKSGAARAVALFAQQDQSRTASASRSASSFVSRNLQEVTGRERQLGRSSLSLQSWDRQSQELIPRSRASLQGPSYHEEKSFAQYVERRDRSGVERYGSRALERTVGDQTYRAGGYLIERGKGSVMEREQEEEEWLEDNANNSALSESDNANATFSTSTYSNRCTIL